MGLLQFFLENYLTTLLENQENKKQNLHKTLEFLKFKRKYCTGFAQWLDLGTNYIRFLFAELSMSCVTSYLFLFLL